MTPLVLDVLANEANFDEAKYLAANPDVARVVQSGGLASGLEHFRHHGRLEGRRLRDSTVLQEYQRAKRERVRPLLRDDIAFTENAQGFDFLTDDLRAAAGLVATEAVSGNSYDDDALALIRKHHDGILLDCGAGRRDVYYDNVVNLDIVAYDTTDVLAIGEALPFKDGSFDGVLSLAVLEHVRDPFQCARELVRVLKPGGDLIACVPFLQPVHSYPNHYYNMTAQGLRNLFEPAITVTRHEVSPSVHPVFSLTWFVQSWADGLAGTAREEFLNMKLSDLLVNPMTLLGRSFVKELPEAKNFELASATVLHGKKG